MPINIVVQRVTSAKLLIDNKDQWIASGDGIVLYISFLKNTTSKEIDHLVKRIFTAQIFRTIRHGNKNIDDENRKSTHILVVPQYSLCGKWKSGKLGAAYHQGESPNVANEHYQLFCKELTSHVKHVNIRNVNMDPTCNNITTYARFGVFGNRQALKIESDGPFSHAFQIELKEGTPSLQDSPLLDQKTEEKENEERAKQIMRDESEMKEQLKVLATKEKQVQVLKQFQRRDTIEDLESTNERLYYKGLEEEEKKIHESNLLMQEEERLMKEELQNYNRIEITRRMSKSFDLRTEMLKDIEKSYYDLRQTKKVIESEEDAKDALLELNSLTKKIIYAMSEKDILGYEEVNTNEIHFKLFANLMRNDVGVVNENIIRSLWKTIEAEINPKVLPVSRIGADKGDEEEEEEEEEEENEVVKGIDKIISVIDEQDFKE